MTKAVYKCKRHFYIPRRVGEPLDLSVEYGVEFRGPGLILAPKKLKQSEASMTKEKQPTPG